MEDGLLEMVDFMNITGIELESDEDIALFNRANSRASRKLIQYLGWTPLYKEAYEEVGIAVNEGVCPTEEQLEQWKEDPETYNFFTEPDTVGGKVKLFPYYPEDANYFIDPAMAIYSVKIVKLVSADTAQFMTVKKLSGDDWNSKTNINYLASRMPVIRWLEICKAPTMLPCKCDIGKSCYMLAVDADWVKSLPEDLMYVLADLILFYMQQKPTLNAGSTYAISSESVDGHSVSYNTNVKNATVKNSEDEVLEPYMAMLKNYIGPYSTLYINQVRVS